MTEKFNYIIARPHDPNNPDAGLNVYTFGSPVKYGTLEEGQDLADRYTTKLRTCERVNPYRVYRLSDI